MTRDEVVDLVAAVDFEFMGKQNWNAFDKYEAFANLVEAEKQKEIDRLKALCEEMLSELYVYRASEYLKDTTAAIKARGLA